MAHETCKGEHVADEFSFSPEGMQCKICKEIFIPQMVRFSLKELESLKTLRQGHTDDLKFRTELSLVWLSRLTVEDGQPYNNQVTAERFVNGKWKTIDTYEAK